MGSIDYLRFHVGFVADEVKHYLRELGRPKWTVEKTLYVNCLLHCTFFSSAAVLPVMIELQNETDTCVKTVMKLLFVGCACTSKVLFVSCSWRFLMRAICRYQLSWILFHQQIV